AKAERRRRPVRPSPMRAFDPRRLGALECRAWAAYYRREWLGVLIASVGLVRHGFGMPWPATLRGAWWVLRANQQWAPYPDNDRAGARRTMARFYALVARMSGEALDADRAADLEVAWWAAHRRAQHGAAGRAGAPAGQAALVDALTDLYAYLYGVAPAAVGLAAGLRAEAMAVSDAWVTAGCDPASPLLAEERALLVRAYAALLAAVHR
ncbi:MAG: hypothetical protein ACRD0F_00360, partial [Acidimicrobiales bacterium]